MSFSRQNAGMEWWRIRMGTKTFVGRTVVASAGLVSLLAFAPSPASADLILDPLHGYCGGTGQCIDNGTNSPTSNNPPTNFGFTVSPGSTPVSGIDFLLKILVPNNENAKVVPFIISGTGQPAGGTTSKLLSGTWTSGDLATFLTDVPGASPNNPIGAYLPSTQALDPGATGFDVYEADLGPQTLQGPSNPNLSPLWNTGAVPLGGYIVGFFNEGTATSPNWIATANSGAIFETSPIPGGGGGGGGAVPEPSSMLIMAVGLLGLGYVMRRRARR